MNTEEVKKYQNAQIERARARFDSQCEIASRNAREFADAVEEGEMHTYSVQNLQNGLNDLERARLELEVLLDQQRLLNELGDE